MISTYDETIHLLKISFPGDRDIYLVLRNTFTHSKSIKENGYFEVCQLAEVQLHLITKHYVETVLNEPFWCVNEIAVMLEPPYGDMLYSDAVIENLEVLVLRDKNGKPVISGGMEKTEFVEVFIRDGDELDGDFSDSREEIRNFPIESYVANYIPTKLYRDVFDMNIYFNRYSRYDYDNKKWISPK